MEWLKGVIVSVNATSGEIWMATMGPVRPVKELRIEGIQDFCHYVPWNRSGEDPDADVDLLAAPEGTAAVRLWSARRRLRREGSAPAPAVEPQFRCQSWHDRFSHRGVLRVPGS